MSVFPGIKVARIDTKKSITGEGEENVDSIEGIIDEITPEFIDKRLGDRDKLMYTLNVTSTTPAMARAKAKTFVRVKNPFEITNVQITSIDAIDENALTTTYSIGVGVTKQGIGD